MCFPRDVALDTRESYRLLNAQVKVATMLLKIVAWRGVAGIWLQPFEVRQSD
jgi:hypothetical protein